MDLEVQENSKNEIIGLKDIYEILPFGKKKILKLIHSNELPVLKVGRTYITTKNKLIDWVESHLGEELYY